MSDTIGPALPPGYTRRSPSPCSSSDQGTTSESIPDKAIGPELPSARHKNESQHTEETSEHGTYGPALLAQRPTTSSTSQCSFGPPLPPNLTQRDDDSRVPTSVSSPRALGPSLPPGFKREQSPDNEDSNGGGGDIGPPHPQEEEDPDIIGPMPVVGGAKDDSDRIKKDIESRSRYMRDKLLGKDVESDARPQREEWMTELPVEFKPLGIGARKFRTNVTDSGDRSVWTDTPADRVRKQTEGQKKKAGMRKVDEGRQVSAREREMAKHVESYNKKHRAESLVDMHRKRRAEERSNEDAVAERRPFNRETDLEAPRNLVTPAKRRALVKDSRTALGDKFSRGSKSFL